MTGKSKVNKLNDFFGVMVRTAPTEKLEVIYRSFTILLFKFSMYIMDLIIIFI